jgi:hypothetical protein
MLLAGCNALFGVDGLEYRGASAAQGAGGAGGASTSAPASSSTGGGAASGGGTSSSAGGAGGGGGLPQGVLAGDDAVVVRYYFDDQAAAGGGPPLALHDAAPDPLDLPITYGNNVGFVDTPTGAALEFGPNSPDARASELIVGTKVESRLTGSTQATIEVVVEMDGAPNSMPRMLDITNFTNNPDVSLRMEGTTGMLSLDLLDESGSTAHSALWNVDLRLVGRAVLHATIDTALGDADDRLRAYIDGASLQSATVGMYSVAGPPAQNTTLSFKNGATMAVGNRVALQREMEGRLYYLAIYERALSAAEIDHNAALLDAADDPLP